MRALATLGSPDQTYEYFGLFTVTFFKPSQGVALTYSTSLVSTS